MRRTPPSTRSRLLLERLALNAPPVESTETAADKAVPAGCVACGSAAMAKLGLANGKQKAAMAKVVDAVHCAIILATIAALPGSGLEAALRAEVATEALAELAGVSGRVAECDHPAFVKEDNDFQGGRMRAIVQRRLADAVAALTAVAEAAGVPSELMLDYPKDLSLQIPCGPCDLCSKGTAHKVNFLITRWDRKKLPTETVHLRYNMAPPVRLRLKKACDAGLPLTVAPAPEQAMSAPAGAEVTVNPLELVLIFVQPAGIRPKNNIDRGLPAEGFPPDRTV